MTELLELRNTAQQTVDNIDKLLSRGTYPGLSEQRDEAYVLVETYTRIIDDIKTNWKKVS